MKLHVRDDEEPDTFWIQFEHWWYPGCRFCGREDYRDNPCPNRPGAVSPPSSTMTA